MSENNGLDNGNVVQVSATVVSEKDAKVRAAKVAAIMEARALRMKRAEVAEVIGLASADHFMHRTESGGMVPHTYLRPMPEINEGDDVLSVDSLDNYEHAALRLDGVTPHAKHGPSKSADLSPNRQAIRAAQSLLGLEKDTELCKLFEKDEPLPLGIVMNVRVETERREKVQPWFADLGPDDIGSTLAFSFEGVEYQGTIASYASTRGRKGGVEIRVNTSNDDGPCVIALGWRDMRVTEVPKFISRKGAGKAAKNPRGPRDPNAVAVEVKRTENAAMLKTFRLQALAKKGAKRDADEEKEYLELRAWEAKVREAMGI